MSRQLDHVFASMISDVVPGPTLLKGFKPRTSIRYEFCNSMRIPVFWRNALGIVVVEPPMASTSVEEFFYIKIEYEFDPGVQIDAREMLSELALPENHVERKGILDALRQLETNPVWQSQRKFSYTLGISREKLEACGGVVYLNDVDLVVGFDKYKEDALHPFSGPGVRDSLSNTVPRDEGIHQRFVLVDNAGVIGNRWINTGYDIFELKPVQDPKLRDGVYVTVVLSRGKEPKTYFYEMGDAVKRLGLYTNRAEAEAFGSPEARFEAEIKEIKRNLVREQTEFANLKQELERERTLLENERRRQEEICKNEEARRKREQAELDAEIKRHQDEMERQRERMRMERERFEFERAYHSDRQKFEYDMASRDRKDQSESLKAIIDVGKAILGILSMALSIYALTKKQK